MNYNTTIENHHADLPCAFVDLDAFDANTKSIAETVKGTSLTIRIATKSLRVPDLIRRVLNSGGPFKGLMCYSALEAEFLSTQGFDDFLIAYPTLQENDLRALKRIHESGKVVSLVLDDERQLKRVNDYMQGCQHPFPVLLELDLSLKWGSLTIGVRRSPLRKVSQIIDLVKKFSDYPHLHFKGLMAYEAQVAGVGDRNPFKKLLTPVLHMIRRYSMKVIQKKRAQLLLELKRMGKRPELFNGGGTGSLSFNRSEEHVLTELTAGSGFYCPHLFDYYSNLSLKPAAFFALQVVRNPENGWYTCQGGGYVASGEPGWDRIPRPLDSSIGLSGFEATGEVQTPIKVSKELNLGSSVIFRHAKAGELAERFNSFLLVQGGEVRGSHPTYRGLGKSFF